MIYYIIILILTLFSVYLQFNPKKSEIRALSIVSFLFILALGGLRYRVGADWYSYENLFNAVRKLSDVFSAREEKLFMLFLYGCKKIANSYSFFVFFLFAISFYLKFKTITKYSPDIFISLIIYFYTLLLIYDLNGIRQGMAMAIVLASLSPILDKKLLQFISLIIIATFFHTSAILFLPFYWLSRINISKRALFIVIAVSLIISIPIRSLIENNSIVQSLLALDSFSHYSTYLTNENTGRDVSIISIAVFQRIFIFSLFFINYNKIIVREDLKLLLFNGYFIAIIIFIFLSFSAEFASRLSFYYKSLEIFMVPIIITSQKRISNRIILVLIFVMLSLLGTYRILEIPKGGLIPYNSILW